MKRVRQASTRKYRRRWEDGTADLPEREVPIIVDEKSALVERFGER